jgi:hypothetical protein
MHYNHLGDVPSLERILPELYVWHLSSPKKRGLIKELGLRVDISNHNCIFANNQSSNIKFMYPFCLELHKGSYTPTNLLKYDFWRINTLGFEAEWYIDPNMTDGPKEFMGDEKYFVFTETPIPSEAIELFEVSQTFIDIKKYVHLTAIEKQTGLEVLIIHNYVDDNYIREEKAEIRKTMKILNSQTSIFSYVQDDPFPLVRAK